MRREPGRWAAYTCNRRIWGRGRIWSTAGLTCISHRLSAAARDKAVSTSLRLVTVLDVLSKYVSAR
jgi:hypothetical protein